MNTQPLRNEIIKVEFQVFANLCEAKLNLLIATQVRILIDSYFSLRKDSWKIQLTSSLHLNNISLPPTQGLICFLRTDYIVYK